MIYVSFLMFNKLPLIYYTQILGLLIIGLDCSWFFIGTEDFSLIVIRQAILKILNIIFIYLFIKSPNDILIYAILPNFINLIYCISCVPSILKRIDINKKYHIDSFTYLKDSIILFIPFIATTINNYSDKIMIGFYDVSKIQNGYYEEAHKIVVLLLTVVTTIGSTLMPRIGALHKQNNVKLINEYMMKSFQLTFLISLPMTFGLICISPIFVPWFLGIEFIDSIPILMILAFSIILSGLSYIIGFEFLIGIGKQKEYTFFTVIGTVLNVALNIVFIPKYAAIGASIATIASQFFIVVIEFIYIRNSVNLDLLLTSFPRYFITTTIMSIMCFILQKNMTPSIFSLFIISLIGATIYIFLLIVQKDAIVSEILNTVSKKIKFIKG